MNVVIGGASGIGAAVATALPGRTLVADISGGDAFCDLRDAGSIERLAASVDQLDALVVTAGVSPTMADARTILTSISLEWRGWSTLSNGWPPNVR